MSNPPSRVSTPKISLNQFYCPPVLTFYQELFPYMSPPPLEWDPICKELFTIGRFSKRYFVWYINLLISIFIGLGSCIHVIQNYKKADHSVVIISSGFAAVGMLFVGCAIIIANNVETLVFGFKCLERLHREAGALVVRHFGSTSGNIYLEDDFMFESKWKKITFGLQGIIVSFAAIPFFVVPVCVYMNIEPFVYTFPKLLPSDGICNGNEVCLNAFSSILVFFRLISSAICATEAMRFYCLFYTIMLYWLEMKNGVMDILEKIPPGRQNDLLFTQIYSAIQIAYQTLLGPMSSLHAIEFGIGFLIFIACNIASIKGFNELPFAVYWIMPCASVLTAYLVYKWTPLDVEVHIRSSKLIKKRKDSLFIPNTANNPRGIIATDQNLRPVRMSVVLRKFKTLKPITMTCGNFFRFQRGSEASYFLSIFFRTVDGVMMLHF